MNEPWDSYPDPSALLTCAGIALILTQVHIKRCYDEESCSLEHMLVLTLFESLDAWSGLFFSSMSSLLLNNVIKNTSGCFPMEVHIDVSDPLHCLRQKFLHGVAPSGFLLQQRMRVCKITDPIRV